jgi:hypothetical protein
MQRTAPLKTLEAMFSQLSPADTNAKKGWRAGAAMAERMRKMKLIVNHILDAAVTEKKTASEMADIWQVQLVESKTPVTSFAPCCS